MLCPTVGRDSARFFDLPSTLGWIFPYLGGSAHYSRERSGISCTMYGAHTSLESPEEALRPQILPGVDHQGAPTCGVGMLHPRPG